MLERSQTQTFYPHDGEDEEDGDVDLVEGDVQNDYMIETNSTNGNKEVVKIVIQKCAICLQRDSVYSFRQCGHHQCFCEDCYQNKGDIDIIKCVV